MRVSAPMHTFVRDRKSVCDKFTKRRMFALVCCQLGLYLVAFVVVAKQFDNGVMEFCLRAFVKPTVFVCGPSLAWQLSLISLTS